MTRRPRGTPTPIPIPIFWRLVRPEVSSVSPFADMLGVVVALDEVEDATDELEVEFELWDVEEEDEDEGVVVGHAVDGPNCLTR